MHRTGPAHSGLRIRYVGGPTALLELGGLRLLTDPTFDPPGEYPIGTRRLVKTMAPALLPDHLGTVDAVLLSHDQHPDNLDHAGRAFLARVPRVLSTASAQTRLGSPVEALPTWQSVDLPRPAGGPLRVTAAPALHGPPGTEHLVGEVTGFVLGGADLPTVYVSGDNASLDVVRAIAGRLGPVDVAVLFVGAAQTALLGDAYLTLTSGLAAEAAQILGARQVVALHFEGWAHFTEGRAALLEAFQRAGLAERLHLPETNEPLDV